MTFKQLFTPGSDLVKYLQTKTLSGRTTRPFVASASAAEFARTGYMTEDASGRTFFAPDADVLLDESFATSHCFHLTPDDAAHVGQIGLAFTPAPGRDTLVDVRGVIWIDRAAPALRSLDFLYTSLEPPAMNRNAGGHIEFVTAPNGISFIERWVLRLVAMEIYRQTSPTQLQFKGWRRQDRTDVRAVQIDETGGQVLVAEWPDGTRWQAPPTGISGHVVQTTAGLPVVHALVALNGGADTVATDTSGAFALARLVPGRYEIIAADTTLSAHVPARRVIEVVQVPRDRVVDVRLKVPPLTDILDDLCKEQRRPKNSTAIVGHVFLDGGILPADATVVAKWQASYENLPSASDPARQRSTAPVGVTIAQQSSKVDNAGRFIVCGVALDRPVQLRLTSRDAKLSDTTFYARTETFSKLEWRLTTAGVP